MARRSAGKRAAGAEAPAGEPADGDDWSEWEGDTPPGRKRPRRPSRASGGRWWVWVGRGVLWAFLIVVIVNGVWHPFRDGFAQPAEDTDDEEDSAAFPEAAASAFALGFAEVYFNAEAEEREEALARYVPEGQVSTLDNGAALSGANLQVVGVEPVGEDFGIVTLTVAVNGEPMRLDVPVYAGDGGESFAVSGPPATLAAPETADLPDEPDAETDPAAREELQEDLENFFEAYAETPDFLDRFLEDGARVTPLPEGLFELDGVESVAVPPAASTSEDVRTVQATVVWRLSGSDDENGLTQSYQLTVVREGTDWNVRDIQGAPHSFGS